MKSAILILIWMCLQSSVVLAQTSSADSLKSTEKEILATDETDIELLGKSRKLILQSLRSGNTVKAKEVVVYLGKRFKAEEVVTFWQSETYLLGFLLKDYSKALAVKDFHNEKIDYRKLIQPPRDLLYPALKKIAITNKSEIAEDLRASGVEPQERDFLLLFLDYLLESEQTEKNKEEHQLYQDDLNQRADDYLREYAVSPYCAVVRRYIRVVYQPSQFGFGFSMGIGPNNLTGNITKDFPRNGFGFDMSLEAFGQKWAGLFQMGLFGMGKLSKTFDYKGTWEKDTHITNVCFTTSLGYLLFDDAFFSVVPFAGIGYNGFSPPTNQNEKSSLSVGTGVSIVGANIDFKINQSAVGYWSVRLRVGYMQTFRETRFAHDQFFISIGGAMFGRTIVRQY